jgi:hypothetical protein
MSDTPCQWCPWRIANHKKKTPWGFYRIGNMRRLWNGIRRGGAQSCHPTDPSHPDHIAAGAKPGSKPKECAGAVILILRELEKLAGKRDELIDADKIEQYLSTYDDGLTRNGLAFWLLGRYQFGGTPFGTGPKLPHVNVDDPEIGRL